jgi:hypothetical protein
MICADQSICEWKDHGLGVAIGIGNPASVWEVYRNWPSARSNKIPRALLSIAVCSGGRCRPSKPARGR